METSRARNPEVLAPSRRWWTQGWLPALLLATATFIAYQPAWRAGFVWDDDVYVTKNRLLAEPGGLQKIWFSREAPSQYCPLVYSTFLIERSMWGLNPTGYHLVNILLHAANAVLVWQLLRRLGVPGAWMGAALFALHPVQVESVAWISERKNVLSLLFYLLSLAAWIEFTESESKLPWTGYVRALAFYLLALASKTTACTLPAAMLLVLWLRQKPIGWRRLGQVAPFVVVGLAFGLLTMWWERYHQGTSGPHFAIGFVQRTLIASHAIFFYLSKLFWPVNLSFSYPRWNITAPGPMALVWPLALAASGAAILAMRRLAGRSLETAALFFVSTLSPLLGFIMLYTFRYTFVADHYQYVASIGPLTLAAAALATASNALGRFKLTAQIVCGGVLMVTLAVLTWRQCRMYRDAETLWRTTIARNPGSFMAHNNLGTTLLRKGLLDPAIEEFRHAIGFQPDYEVAWYNLGTALGRQGQVDAAITHFEEALRLDPTYAAAHNNLANLCVRTGRPRDARAHYERALALRPNNADTANNLAWLLATSPAPTLRDGRQAVTLAREANRLSGGRDPGFLTTLAAAYAEAGQFPAAISCALEAQALARAQFNFPLVNALGDQIKSYEASLPFRDNQNSGPAAPP